jgi:hypothetical protein
MSSIALALLSALGGVTVTALAGLVGALVQSRRDHARWLREKRYAVYLGLLQEFDLTGDVVSEVTHEKVRRYVSEIGLVGPASLLTPVGRFIRADTPTNMTEMKRARSISKQFRKRFT